MATMSRSTTAMVCNLYKEVASNDSDSALDFTNVDGNDYLVSLANARSDGSVLYLTAIGDSNGTSATTKVDGNVMWATKNSGDAHQIWTFEYMTSFDQTMDLRKLDAQVFLHKFYSSTISIDAKAGTVLCTELVKALQNILLDMTGGDGYGTFGPATLAACPTIDSTLGATEKNKKLITLFCHAMFCKGYSTTAIYDTYNEKIAAGIKKLQADVGLAQTGSAEPTLVKAVFNTDSYVLSDKGDSRVREIQQAMNSGYRDYSGINPCDGVYSRATNKALIYAVQKEEGITVENSAPSFGVTTFGRFPTLPFTGTSKESGINEQNLIKILQYALYVNDYYAGEFDGVYSDAVVAAVKDFQTFMAYPGTPTDYTDARVMKGLLSSCGDTSRSCLACDTVTILNSTTATALYNAGYRYIGRYLTGRVLTDEGNRVNKAMSRQEAEAILAEGLSIIPIYQDGGWYISYFTKSRGESDAQKAYDAAKALGIPEQSIIYFAVDVDVLDSQMSSILTYFSAVQSTMKDYYIGIYGTRNVCTTITTAGYAFKCYVSDLSSGYSGNLGFKMPAAWAFDQFGSDTVDGVTVDKVAYSGQDSAVKQLYDVTLSQEEIDDNALLAAIRSKICDFQECIPVLRMLPNLSVSVNWKQTIMDTGNIKIEYAVATGASTAVDDSLYTFSISPDGTSISENIVFQEALNAAKIWDGVTDDGGSSDRVSQKVVIDLFSRISDVISTGSTSISVSPNPAAGEVKIGLTCEIPNLYVTENTKVLFSQTISITIRQGSSSDGDTTVTIDGEQLLGAFDKSLENGRVALGKAIATITSTIDNDNIVKCVGEAITISTLAYLIIRYIIPYISLAI